MRKSSLVGLLFVMGFLAACTSPTTPAAVETVVVPGPTQVVTATPLPTPTSSPTTLVVCQDVEPETLYLYGGSYAARNVHEAIYDGPIDHRSFDFQPVILTKLPSLEDGDAYFDQVQVQPGDLVVDVNGQPVTLEEGVQVFDRHTCLDATNPDCVVTAVGTTTIQMEQMVVSWQLREEITWADGEPVTADDSVYSYELACDPNTPTSKYLCDRTASYITAGERTVVWTGLPGYVDDLYPINFFTPLPRHLWQEELGYTAWDLLSQPESTRTPMGWGPFVITEWAQGSHITLERNPHYFRAAEGLPRVDRLVFRFAQDVYDLTSMLMAGECDIGLTDQDLGPLMPLLVSAQEEGLLSLQGSPSSHTWENITLGINPVSTYDRPDFFEDVRVRQAIAQCIDRQTIVNEVTYGMGQVADVYVPPDHPLYAADQIHRWPYDPQTARALLAEVGWVDEDGDGVVEAVDVEKIRDGTSFRVTMLVMEGNRQQETIARIVRSNLADCGILVDLEFVPPPEFRRDGPEGPVFGRRFDMALFAWQKAEELPCYLYMTDEIPDEQDWGRSNAAGFSNEEYDQACRAARAALPGTFEREHFYAEAQRIFSEQLPSLPLLWRVRLALTRPTVTGFQVDSSAESLLQGVEEIGR